MQDNYYINGIQQVGIGVHNVYKAWDWYKKYFHFDLPIFDEKAEAKLMLPHTEGLSRTRHAILALNYQGGGGLEIWQHTSFESRGSDFEILPGDLGIGILKIKVKNLQNSFDHFTNEGINILTDIVEDPLGRQHFYLKDPYGNIIEILQSNEWHADKSLHSGGVYGTVIGVSNMDKALQLYRDLLKYDITISDSTSQYDDYDQLTNTASYKYRRVILSHSTARNGAFSKLLGKTEIELVQVLDRSPNKIFKNRMWGELGYIHLCFDVNNIDVLKTSFSKKGYPFTVDSANSFDMGEAAGRFAYIADQDGTLIEFVETHKIPIFKKLNLYFDLRKRPAQKPLPKLLLWAMSLMRVK